LIPLEKPRGKRRSVDLRETSIVKRTEPGFKLLPRRWVVERTFAWLGRNRRLSKDYEQLPEVSQAMVYVAMVRLMLRRLVSASCIS
jgi:putative transposase